MFERYWQRSKQKTRFLEETGFFSSDQLPPKEVLAKISYSPREYNRVGKGCINIGVWVIPAMITLVTRRLCN